MATRSEKKKMLAGDLYDALDPELVAERRRARDLLHDLNGSRDVEQEKRREILGITSDILCFPRIMNR